MFLSSETLTALISLGAPPEKLAEVLRMIERDAESVQPRRSSGDSDSKAAERMRRYRRRREEGGMKPYFEGYMFVQQLRDRDGPLCVYCQDAEGTAVDHITPISRGGTDHIDNLALACHACNGGKAGREPVGRYSPQSPTAREAHVRYVRSRSGEQSEQGEPALSLSPSPQTPQPHTHTHGDIYTPREKPSPSDFDQFWAAYPAKVGKKAALKAWTAAKDRPPLPVLLVALETYRATKPPDRDWCHASTWLSQGRWDDEPPDPIPARQTPQPRPPHDRPRSSSKSEHLDGIARAMEAACQPDFHPPRDPWESGDGGGVRALPSAA